ncbi:MAG TPA: acyl-CoA dehydrogenase family protein [bacterium]|nr:acyl-CoA dehydrogenase family protein [bacterium]
MALSFEFTDEQNALRETARRYAQDVIVPVSHKYDESAEFPKAEIRKAWELGLMNECIPEANGGLGLGVVEMCILAEEIAAGCAGFWTSTGVNNLGLTPIVIAGSEELKKRILNPFVEEFRICAFCLTEPNAGSDAGGLSLTATRKGDGWVLNGAKQWITNGGVADVYTVFATADRAKKQKGIMAMVVEKGTPGLIIGKKEDKMGQRASDTRQLTFEDCFVPDKNVLAPEGKGFGLAMQTLDRTRPGVAAAACGISRTAMNHAVKYAKERVAFGAPIAAFQGIQFILADMAKDLEASRLLTYQAAWMIDQGKKASMQSSFAKCFATDACMRITTDAVQVYGGYGYTKEYPVEKLMRDAKLMQIYEGTNQIQRVVIAKELLA